MRLSTFLTFAFVLGVFCSCECSNPETVENLNSSDSLTFEITTLEKALPCPAHMSGNCLEISIQNLRVTAGAPDSVLGTIEGSLAQALSSTDNNDYKTNNAEGIAQNLIAEYQQIIKELPDYGMAWNYQSYYDVFLNQQGLFGVQLSNNTFTGGAHPNSFTTYYTYSSHTGKKLDLKDLLNEGQTPELEALAEKKLRDLYEVPSNQTLEDAGFWFENNVFALSEHFKYNPQGLYFWYNQYEIASYAFGPVEIFFSYDEIKRFIRPQYLLPTTAGEPSEI